MPNTLAHFGAQGVLSRVLLPGVDPKLVLLGCLLPDVPWILQRLFRAVLPSLDPYSLRLYVIVQGSLFGTLFLCGAIAAISKPGWKVFWILALNAGLHLSLDALQTKWANGVHLLAPFSWELLNLGMFWPESLPTYLLTLLGLGYVAWSWKQTVSNPFPFTEFSSKKIMSCLGLLCLYFLLPLLLLEKPKVQDNHFVQTLRKVDSRVGHKVEFDRNAYLKGDEKDVIRTFAGEKLGIVEGKLDHSAQVSVRGRFVKADEIEILEIHEHSRWFRDSSNYIGILLLLTIWGVSLSHAWAKIGPFNFSRRTSGK